MATQDYVVTPHRIVDPELQRVVYGPGERVPLDDAVKYGLVDAATAAVAGEAQKTAPAPRKGTRKATETRPKPAESRPKATETRPRKAPARKQGETR